MKEDRKKGRKENRREGRRRSGEMKEIHKEAFIEQTVLHRFDVYDVTNSGQKKRTTL